MNKNENLIENKPKKSGKFKYSLSVLFLIAMIVITFVVILTEYNINDVIKVLNIVDLRYLIVCLVLVFIYIFFEGMATRKILKSLGHYTSIKDNFEYAAVDYYYCAITPSASGGQPMVAYHMAKDDIPVEASTQVLLVNTALFKFVLIVLSLVSLIFSYEYIFDNSLMLILFILGITLNILIIVFCGLCTFKRSWLESLGKRIIMLLARWKVCKKPVKWTRILIKKMDEYEQGAKYILQNKHRLFIALIYNFIQRIALFSCAYFVYLAFQKAFPQLSGFGYFDLFAIQTIIALSVDSLPLPGGMGISEILYVTMFEIVYGGIVLFDEGTLVASAMLLTRAVSFYLPLIITAIITIKRHIVILCKNKKAKKEC